MVSCSEIIGSPKKKNGEVMMQLTMRTILIVICILTVVFLSGCLLKQPSPQIDTEIAAKFVYGDIISNDPSNYCTAEYVQGRFTEDKYILKGVTRCNHTYNTTWKWTGYIRIPKITEIDSGLYVIIDQGFERNISGPYPTLH